MNRALAHVLFLGLFVAGAYLVFWLNRHYRSKGGELDAKVAFAWAALSFIGVGAGMVFSTFPASGPSVGPGGKELPPETFAIVPAAVFFCCALLAAIGLMLGAVFQLVSSWFRPSRDALRHSAARLAIFGVGASIVAFAHLTILRLGSGLLK